MYKEKIKNISNMIQKIEDLMVILKTEEKLSKDEKNIFFQNKNNFNFTNELILYFYNLYYMNSNDYLLSLNKLIETKIDYLKKD